MSSRNADLQAAFSWAKKQAMAYAFQDDPVGLWYEAALPGREAFCMRDVSHQAMGAHALGLERHTFNMLRLFAENISESKDWCSYWEINRYGLPAPVDYQDDARFWYNLPANFDVLNCCYRMYLWTGDRTYIDDPAFLNFYDRTVTDYVERWDLGLDRIMTRKRIMNYRGRFDPEDKFIRARGIPSYEESSQNFVVAADQIAIQYAGYLAYSHLQRLRGNESAARRYLQRAREVRAFFNAEWWDEGNRRYYSFLNTDYELEHGGLSMRALYNHAAEDGPKLRAALEELLQRTGDRAPNVEGQSHLPEVLYQYGETEAAYRHLIDLTREDKPRREYPEVSYSVVGAIVTGLMGITVEPAPPSHTAGEPDYIDRAIMTLPQLPPETESVELADLPVRANELDVRHIGARETVLTNKRGPSLIWKACFPGTFDTLVVNGVPATAQQETLPPNRTVSCVRTPVGADNAISVAVPKTL